MNHLAYHWRTDGELIECSRFSTSSVDGHSLTRELAVRLDQRNDTLTDIRAEVIGLEKAIHSFDSKAIALIVAKLKGITE